MSVHEPMDQDEGDLFNDALGEDEVIHQATCQEIFRLDSLEAMRNDVLLRLEIAQQMLNDKVKKAASIFIKRRPSLGLETIHQYSQNALFPFLSLSFHPPIYKSQGRASSPIAHSAVLGKGAFGKVVLVTKDHGYAGDRAIKSMVSR